MYETNIVSIKLKISNIIPFKNHEFSNLRNFQIDAVSLIRLIHPANQKARWNLKIFQRIYLNLNWFFTLEEIDPFDMICGDDISRLPDVVNPNEKKPETIEEEKPSYAAVARSRPTSECNDNELVEDPVVEDVVEEPGTKFAIT